MAPRHESFKIPSASWIHLPGMFRNILDNNITTDPAGMAAATKIRMLALLLPDIPAGVLVNLVEDGRKWTVVGDTVVIERVDGFEQADGLTHHQDDRREPVSTHEPTAESDTVLVEITFSERDYNQRFMVRDTARDLLGRLLGRLAIQQIMPGPLGRGISAEIRIPRSALSTAITIMGDPHTAILSYRVHGPEGVESCGG